jgi:predicted ArsR family transcriptional regulator
MIRVTESELLAELRAALAPEVPADALTIAELCASLGLGKRSIQERLKVLHEEGRLAVYRVRRIDQSGRPQMIPAYAIKPAPPSSDQRQKQHRRPSRKRST